MENNDLEDKIRKMVKEKIAVSNIKEELKIEKQFISWLQFVQYLY